VGGLFLFTLPRGATEEVFLDEVMELLLAPIEFRKPFGEYVTTGRAGAAGGLYWKKDDDMDMEYHVRHSALPQPGRYRELFALVSRLHSTLLDRSRPLWEIHLIEGLQNRQFALYMKMHHSAIDGISGLQMVESMCSTDRRSPTAYSPLSIEAYEQFKQERHGNRPRSVAPKESELKAVTELLKQQFDTSVNLLGVARDYAKTWLGMGGGLTVPWRQIPHSAFSSRISGSRRFVAQSWNMDRVKAVCKSLDGTLNDVVLAICAGAMRRYLVERNELPDHSLKAMIPVSVRKEGDTESANAIAAIAADLATNIENPERRFRKIQESTLAGKQMVQGLSPSEAALLFQLTQLPALLVSMMGMAERLPAFSAIISNVPGPRRQLYWKGARLDGIYPANIPFDGMAMSITLVSYNNMLDFGITACRRSLPGLQRMIDYMEEALVELEDVVGRPADDARRRTAGTAGSKKVRKKKRKTTAKTGAKKKVLKKVTRKSKPLKKTTLKKKPRKTVQKRA